jgi:tRNA A-37 threonylcarbamoyl transferase component Bud32
MTSTRKTIKPRIREIADELKEDFDRSRMLQGSGESTIVEFPELVLKIFDEEHDTSIEATILNTVDSDNIIRMVGHGDDYIAYEKIKPLKEIVNPTRDELVQQLANIAVGLYDLHSAGYVHGDVAIGNIGINGKGNYILYDLETAVETDDPGLRYRDVEMFLEDLVIQYKERSELQRIVKDLLEKMRREHRREQIVRRRMPSGRYRELKSYTYVYKPEDFGMALLQSIGR